MKHLKTFEAHSIKKDVISKEKLQEILSKSNLVTLPYLNDENAIHHHIDKNFDDSDVAFLMNPPKDLTSVENTGDRAFLYTKHKTYMIEDISEIEFGEMEGYFNQNGMEQQNNFQ